MSGAYKCDVCGKFYEKGIEDKEARPTIRSHNFYTVDGITIYSYSNHIDNSKSYDLCSGCATKLMDFLNMNDKKG